MSHEIGTLKVKSLNSIADLDQEDVATIFSLASRVKEDRFGFPKVLKDQRLAMLFEKESLRTRVTFDVGIQDLGVTGIAQ